jgi:hypothetical protein
MWIDVGGFAFILNNNFIIGIGSITRFKVMIKDECEGLE